MKSLLEYIIEYDNTDQYDIEYIDEGLGDTIKKTWYKFKNLFKTSVKGAVLMLSLRESTFD